MSDYERGYQRGFSDGYAAGRTDESFQDVRQLTKSRAAMPGAIIPKKRPASPKMKLLTKMTATKWAKYSKGSGKKSYVQIRAEVSRSMAYKKKCKGMK